MMRFSRAIGFTAALSFSGLSSMTGFGQTSNSRMIAPPTNSAPAVNAPNNTGRSPSAAGNMQGGTPNQTAYGQPTNVQPGFGPQAQSRGTQPGANSPIANQQGPFQSGINQPFGQQRGGLQPMNQQPAGQAIPAPVAQAPFKPLTPELQKYLDDVLKKWSDSTKNVERYKCDFKRWTYDPTQTKADIHYSQATGIIRYMTPDKGMYKVDHLWTYAGADAKPLYTELVNQFGEWWICDGQKVYMYDRTRKEVRQFQLPPNMQGKQIADSPLPFVFGVDAAKLKERYWLQPLPPPVGADRNPRLDIIGIEAFPKHTKDAANYLKVQIYLDTKDFLPASIIMFEPNYQENFPARSHYDFEKREKNWTLLDRIADLNIFKREFIPEQPPSDWKVLPIEGLEDPNPVDPQRVASPPQPISGKK